MPVQPSKAACGRLRQRPDWAGAPSGPAKGRGDDKAGGECRQPPLSHRQLRAGPHVVQRRRSREVYGGRKRLFFRLFVGDLTTSHGARRSTGRLAEKAAPTPAPPGHPCRPALFWHWRRTRRAPQTAEGQKVQFLAFRHFWIRRKTAVPKSSFFVLFLVPPRSPPRRPWELGRIVRRYPPSTPPLAGACRCVRPDGDLQLQGGLCAVLAHDSGV